MRRKKFPLSEKGISDAIKYLENYKKQIILKTEQLLEELSKVGIKEADARYRATVGETTDKSHAFVKSVEFNGKTVTMNIEVQGEDIIFIEFGAGIHYNNVPAGSNSPNPYSEKFGYQIGRYPKGQRSLGVLHTWTHEGVKTHGTKATMPVYGAVQAMTYEILLGNIARKVFKDWS